MYVDSMIFVIIIDFNPLYMPFLNKLFEFELLLMSNPIRQHSNLLYSWEVMRRGNIGKHRKVGVQRKWRVLAQPPYSMQGNGRQSPRAEPFKMGDRPPDAEENQGSQYRQRLLGQARPRADSR